jgi:hypothetical protein
MGACEILGNELVQNGSMESGAPTPDCFQLAEWGDHTTQAGVVNGGHTGNKAYRIALTNYQSGDAKLLTAESGGCAPSVEAGKIYQLSVWYRSTSARNAVTAFRHTSAGWTYWTDLQTMPAVASWTEVVVKTPPIPAGTDRIAWGVSTAAAGVLFTDDYSTAEVIPVTEPTSTTTTTPTSNDPAVVGRWSVLPVQMTARAMHATVLRDGRVLLVAGSGNSVSNFEAGDFRTIVWNPANNSFLNIPTPEDMFCVGHVTLADGRVLVQGGTLGYPESNQTGVAEYSGLKSSYIFDPATNRFTRANDANEGHWYPTLTMLGNGDVWMAGGLKTDTTGAVNTEMWDDSQQRWLGTGEVPQTWSFWGLYPHMVLMNDGRLFYTGGHVFGDNIPGTGAAIYNWQTAQITNVPGLREKDKRDQAASVLLPPAQDQKVLIAGGGNINSNPDAINLADVIDLKAPSPSYRPTANVPGPGKMYLNSVLLPDRTVFTAHGAKHNREDDVQTAAIFQPTTETWKPIVPDPVLRQYHSTTVLLPDGRVAAFGSNPADNTYEMRISIYEPPYLFKSGAPTVANVPSSMTYGQTLNLTKSGTIQKVQLMRTMSVTHQSDPNARLVDVPFAVSSPTSMTVTIPTNRNLLPPGVYFLNALNDQGVPSTSKAVVVR